METSRTTVESSLFTKRSVLSPQSSVLAVLCLLLIACIPAIGGGSAPKPAFHGTLVYGRDVNVWAMGPDLQPRKLTNVAGGELARDPAWSRDGQRIAYTQMRPAEGSGPRAADLYTMAADGRHAQKLLTAQQPSEALGWPVWSPDGKFLYFEAITPIMKDGAFQGDRLEVGRLDLASGARSRVAADATNPDVSADGKQLAYVVTDQKTGDQSIWLAGPDGREARELVGRQRPFAGLYAPVFSPAGQRLVFAAGGTATSQRPRGSLDRLVTLLAGARRAEAHGIPWDLWIVNLDGTGLRKLTQLAEDALASAWSRDGRQIVFQGENGTYLVNADGTGLARLTPTAGLGRIDWRDE